MTETPPDDPLLARELAALRAKVAELEQAAERQRTVETDLRASLAQAQAYLDRSYDSVFTLDRDGRYRFANQAFAEGVGKPLDTIVGRTQWDIFPKEEADSRFGILSETFRTGEVRIIEVRVPRDDGDRYYLTTLTPVRDAHGAVEQVLCISKNITDRKRAEDALRASQDQLTSLLEHSPIATAIVAMDGTIEYINQRAIDTFGYRPEDIPTMAAWWQEAYPDAAYRAEVIATWTALMEEAGRTNQEIARHEYRVTRKDGRVLPTLIFGALIAGKVFVLFDDLTAFKAAEQERLDLERRLLHAQKLESLGVLAGGVAHDFNNLLMAIIGNIDLALLGVGEGSQAWEDLQQAMAASRRAASLVHRMLAYSGRGAYAVGPVDLNALLAENATMLRAATAKTATLEVLLEPGLEPVVADAAQLQQIVMNLITNASEALGDKPGTIRLTTGSGELDAAALAKSSLDEKPQPGRFVWLEVADDGHGMTEDTRQRLFEPFFTTKFTGRGLGMSAVLGIVRAHGGAIMVDSAPNVGTTVRVLFPLPLGGGRPSAAAPSVAEARTTPLGGVALVVDDEDDVLRVTTALLERLGFEVLTATDGVEALRRCDERGREIDVVLLDMTMPQMDGLTTFRELRRRGLTMPVVLCSGFSETENAERFGAEGLAGFLQKPFERARLEAELVRVLQRR